MKTKYILTREEVASIAYQHLPMGLSEMKGKWTFLGLKFEYIYPEEEVQRALIRYLDLHPGSYDISFYGLDGYTGDIEVTVIEREEKG